MKPAMKKWITVILLFVLLPLLIGLGIGLSGGKLYAFLYMATAIIAMIPFFLSFEKGKADARMMLLIAVMTALSVLGRILFAVTPSFKPVTAMVILTALYFGREAGFLTGALSALLSNLYFGQGPWTPFQMFTWGLIGFIAGVLAKPLKKSRIALLLYGGVAGAIFSLLMDFWSTLWESGSADPTRFFAHFVAGLPVLAVITLSNVIFLWVLAKPIGRILSRLQTKYGIGLAE